MLLPWLSAPSNYLRRGNADVMLMLTFMPILKMDLDVSAGFIGGRWGSQ